MLACLCELCLCGEIRIHLSVCSFRLLAEEFIIKYGLAVPRMGKYSDTMMDLVLSPRSGGVIEHADLARHAGTPGRGAILILLLRAEDGRIASAKYQFQVCSDQIAMVQRPENSDGHEKVRELSMCDSATASVEQSLRVRCRVPLRAPAIPEEVLSTDGTESHGTGRVDFVTWRPTRADRLPS